MNDADSIKPLLSAESIRARTEEVAAEIATRHASDDLVFLTVLEGGAPFARALHGCFGTVSQAEVGVSSYGGSTQPLTHPVLTSPLPTNLNGRTVMVIDDIFDTGNTLSMLSGELLTAGAGAVEYCVLLRKTREHEHPLAIDYVGFDIPDEFVVGFGLDFDGVYRDLDYVGVLTPGARRL